MIVKTSIRNPTQKKQMYPWVPPNGVYVGPGGEFIVNGDVYTRNILANMPRNNRHVDADVRDGRAIVTILTDMPTKCLTEQVETPVKTKPVEMAPIKVEPDVKVEVDDSENILGKGLVEIKEDPASVFDVITGEKRDDSGYPERAENINDYLWSDKKNEDFIFKADEPERSLEEPAVNTASFQTVDPEVKKAVDASKREEDPGKTLSRKDLKKMSLAALRALAAKKGMADMAQDADKAELVDWLYENQ